MKQFIQDIKWMWKLDYKKETFKLAGMMLLFAILMSTAGFQATSSYFCFMFFGAPIIMFCVPLFSFYRPMFREVEKDIELEQKYPYFYHKFNKKCE